MPATHALRSVVVSFLVAVVLTGCAALSEGEQTKGTADASTVVQEPADSSARDAVTERRPGGTGGEGQDDAPSTQVFEGTGEFIDREAAQSQPPVRETEGGSVLLNFQGADLREVVRYVMGDLLNLNYSLDPGVKGRVTMATSRPLKRDAVLPTLEEILRMNGAALVRDGSLYRIVPSEKALRGTAAPSLSETGPGLNVRIVPLEYIAASEMRKILEPFLSPGSLVRVDDKRNLLILAGTREELRTWINTVDIFDVDWLKGMSVGLFALENTDVEELAKELETVFGGSGDGPLAGMFRFVPIKRLNSLLVVTPQSEYLDQARTWVHRLDRGGGSGGQRLYVYRMRHGDAENAAKMLQSMFGGESSDSSSSVGGPSLAPGASSQSIGDTADSDSAGGDSQSASDTSGGSMTTTLGGEEDSIGLKSQVKVIADKTNNALLIMASPADYDTIESAIEKLDISALQVLVDATIVEVRLSGDLRYGMQWFFQNRVDDGHVAEGELVFGEDQTTPNKTFPGFSYSLVNNAGDIRAVLNALASDNKVNVVSAPSVMVLDNQTATIQVGDQVPVRTSQSTRARDDSDSDIITSGIEYRDTGVSLEVTPRVNAGGMVTMEIRQEVNDVSETTDSGIDSPTITQRVLESVVAVPSGQTIVLGGLIRETNSTGESGIPGLRKLPVLGALFSTRSKERRRTELLVLLTPRVAENAAETAAITQEFRQRMEGLSEESAEFFRRQSQSRWPESADEKPAGADESE
ncbi:type II secretion system secretin GspD [Arhodomonas sp. AD133]|uniref:type II secretion system secretin GspD n=1 Tax=Arhodomonas sp. AD133 TaxID=3415009 RepID=UPI003EBC502D